MLTRPLFAIITFIVLVVTTTVSSAQTLVINQGYMHGSVHFMDGAGNVYLATLYLMYTDATFVQLNESCGELSTVQAIPCHKAVEEARAAWKTARLRLNAAQAARNASKASQAKLQAKLNDAQGKAIIALNNAIELLAQ